MGRGAVFINHTNHPSANWEEPQFRAARLYGDVVDLPFPAVDPEMDREGVRALAMEILPKILEYNPSAVLCQGDFSYTYMMVNLLKEQGIPVFAASSHRMVEILQGDDGMEKQVSRFRFVRFREY